MLKYLKNSQNKINEQIKNFYTPLGIQVYFKDPLMNDDLDIEKAVSRLEELVPKHLLSEIEMIIFGQFDEFEEKEINAFYRDGTLNISNFVDNEEEILGHMIHETSHSVEEAYGKEIYFDQKIKNEFLSKRMVLYDIMWKMGFKIPKSLFSSPEYNYELDMYLLQEVGYSKLSEAIRGLFINPYAVTSLREYFATGFTEFFTHPNDHNYLKKISPKLFKKIELIYDEEKLDTN
jgi:hypothetical protein|tara:strand:- start:2883 stop:3581 length:699 start_codon:yes stop_codon:yes gene_type:complete